MRKALIVGIDHYQHIGSLGGCVNDAYAVSNALERHADGAVNFATPKLLVGPGPSDIVTREELKAAVQELFADPAEIALFYFAGHGHIEDAGGYLCAGDCKTRHDGLSLSDVLFFATKSPASNKVIVLDSCHSGLAGRRNAQQAAAEISDGMTILTASTETQYAMEVPGGGAGVFTTLFVDALSGAAANLVGAVTPGAIYAHIDQSLGPWKQRPVFKTNVKTFVSLKQCVPPIPTADLRALTTHFPKAGHRIELDPSFEPERSPDQKADPSIPAPDPAKTAVFAVLQRYARVNLVRPVDAPHMWHAAMGRKSCEMTVLGEHYRNLVEEKLI